jgi:hypothetical protein
MSRKKRNKKPDRASPVASELDKAKGYGNQEKNNANNVFSKFNLIAGAVAIAASVATVGLYFLTRETLRIEQRAFVYVKDKDLIGLDPAHPVVPSQGNTAALTIDFYNSGPTPARNVTGWVAFCVKSGNTLPSDFSYPGANFDGTTYPIPPQSDSKSVTPIPISYLDRIRDRREFAFVWGATSYSDVFNTLHQTQYCYFLRGTTVGPEGQGEVWQMCSQHNCIDEDCPAKWGDNADEQDCPQPAKPN